jgi:endogenous inhibitor of DNA gyrase (YacG/DUF329 family)
MECPICGEKVPLNSEVCPFCGNSSDEFFLTEAAIDSRHPVPAEKKHIEPRARKKVRHLDWSGVLALTGGGAVVLALILIAVFFAPRGASLSWSKPEQVVRGYYEALAQNDLKGMLSMVADAYQPTTAERSLLDTALRDNTYKVSGLEVRVLSNDRTEARVALENVVVTITPKGGGEPVTHSLRDEIIAPARQAAPNTVMLVRLVFYSNAWKIEGRPYGGWAPKNIWALGQPSDPNAGTK